MFSAGVFVSGLFFLIGRCCCRRKANKIDWWATKADMSRAGSDQYPTAPAHAVLSLGHTASASAVDDPPPHWQRHWYDFVIAKASFSKHHARRAHQIPHATPVEVEGQADPGPVVGTSQVAVGWRDPVFAIDDAGFAL